jgi:hypothetical protein
MLETAQLINELFMFSTQAYFTHFDISCDQQRPKAVFSKHKLHVLDELYNNLSRGLFYIIQLF